jgi:type II secretory pathway pseudopilin PulG
MVISEVSHPTARRRRQHGALMVELLVALAILAGVLLPLAYSFVSERRLARGYYQRAVAMEIVDGEMEALLAGEWHAFSPGTHDYQVHAGAITNLPPGRFILSVRPGKLQLRWQPARKDHGGPVTREALLK